MVAEVKLESIYTPSQNIVAREIEGDLIIVPVLARLTGIESEICALNETGRAMWKQFDGQSSLKQVALSVAAQYDAPPDQVERDILVLIADLLRRRMVVEMTAIRPVESVAPVQPFTDPQASAPRRRHVPASVETFGLKQLVPLYVVDEHNEAYSCWQRARVEGVLKQPLDLFHLDAHSDMGRPESFRRSLYAPTDDDLEYHRDFANSELNNGSFIVPAVLAGLVKDVYFIYPEWRKYKPSRKRFSVASVFGEGKLIVHGKRTADKMGDKLSKALPDLVNYEYSELPIANIPQNRRVILDIDLDYFACRDSIRNAFYYELAITAEQYHNREKLLSDMTLQFAGLSFEFKERSGGYAVRVRPRPTKEQAYLPTQTEISSQIFLLVNLLKEKKIQPAVVTIARSCISGYCPVEYVDSIETELIERLSLLLAS